MKYIVKRNKRCRSRNLKFNEILTGKRRKREKVIMQKKKENSKEIRKKGKNKKAKTTIPK